MAKWIFLFSIIILISCLESKNLFFKDLTSHPLYKSNHIYRPLDTVTYKDSIMYVQEMDYLLISTNNTILNLDIYTLDELQKLTLSNKGYLDNCFVDHEASEYSCHLFGHWSKIIALSTESSVNQLFVCHNDDRATYHNLHKLEIESSPESKCRFLSGITFFGSDYHFYIGDVKEGRKILRFPPRFSENSKIAKKNNLYSSIDSNWLQQNDYLQFVFVFENGDFVYFLFRETADEDNSYCNVKGVKSRVSRVSKDDKGGSNYRLINSWTTFVKATIICFDDDTGNLDSSLRYIEAASYDNERKFLYATFSSGRSAPHSSAICQYSISDIDQALDGLYMNVKDPKTPVPKYETDCLNSNEDCKIQRAVRYQLKFMPIVPSIKRNFIRQNGEIWTHIQVLTIDRSSRQYDVIFVATSKSKIKKFYRKLTDNFLCYSETLSLSENDNNPPAIRDMRIINAKKSPQLFLLVTVTNGVYKVGVEHCLIHLTEYLCIDPFCYWESELAKCKSIFQLEVYKLRQLPLLTQCTDGTELFDPVWKQWSSWKNYANGNDVCENRIRFCREGACANTGSLIPNIEIEVRNCSQHNQWTAWSEWSACSSTCGPGIATRRRWCFQNGGCVGESDESRNCILSNQCQGGNYSVTNVWSDWSKCSNECGDGITIRTKTCDDNTVSSDGLCKLFESKRCVEHNCQVFSKYVLGDLADGSDKSLYLARCSGNLSRADQLEAVIEYESFRQNDTFDLVWECWSEWTNCSAYCSGIQSDDYQRVRTRNCKVEDPNIVKHLCIGQSKETDTCKEENCLEAVMVITNDEKGFQLVYIILVGVASFSATCIMVIIGVCVYFSRRKQGIAMNAGSNTLARRPTFQGTSYSPVNHSPMASPGYRNEPFYADTYSSLNRPFRQNNLSPTYMATPRVVNDIPIHQVHREQF